MLGVMLLLTTSHSHPCAFSCSALSSKVRQKTSVSAFVATSCSHCSCTVRPARSDTAFVVESCAAIQSSKSITCCWNHGSLQVTRRQRRSGDAEERRCGESRRGINEVWVTAGRAEVEQTTG